MPRERFINNNKAGSNKMQGGDYQSPRLGRSPALDSLEQREQLAKARGSKRAQPASAHQGVPQTRGRTRRAAGKRTNYAAQEASSFSASPRRSLPRSSTRLGAVNIFARVERRSNPGPTSDWGTRKVQTAEQPSIPVQIISDEEQLRLTELEMQLPREAGKADSWLMVIVLALLCMGLVMVYSASSFMAARCCGDASYYFQRQLLSALLGIVVMLVTMRIDYRQWRRFSLIGMAIGLPLLVVVLFVGTNVYGASRWLTFGSFFSFQPSELIKLVLALYIADWLARKGKQVGTFLYGLAPFVILVGLILGLVLLENDMGTAIIIAGLAAAMFFTAGANIAQFLLTIGCGALVFMTQAFRGYRLYRLLGFLDPFQHVTSINLQLYQSLLALGSGNWFGLGLGASRQKTGYLPLPYIDSIFAIIGEELGFIGCAIIVALFLALAFRGFRLARRTQDVYGALLATGITTWLILQAIINIGATTGSIPYTGVPLPFISYGGSSLVISMAGIGVLLNISRYIQEPDVPALSKRALTNTLQFKKS